MDFRGDAAVLLLMVVCVRSSSVVMEMTAQCNTNASLPCEALAHTQDYRTLIWYKQNKTGILMESKGKIEPYSYPRAAGLGPQGQLILPHVAPNDSGTYECHLRPQLGGMTKEPSYVHLSVAACIVPMRTPPPVVLPPRASSLAPPLVEVVLVHAGWAALGFTSLSLLKLLLCLLSIQVFCMCKRHRKQQTETGSVRSQRA